ncbi:MAG: PhoH family protein [Schleiferiaceae bacterium]|nr:PhoH family protein [Schleiferiaceae bacterium]
MIEKEIQIENPQAIYGANNRYLNYLKEHFPKLKITARGQMLKVQGEGEIIANFEDKLDLVLDHIEKYNTVTENQLERILQEDRDKLRESLKSGEEVLLTGVGGHLIRARTMNQRAMVKAVAKNDMLFALGPAGTGKTYTAVALAVRALKNREVKRIILTRPAVEAGENLGFLPGDLKEKLDPYMQPLYDALRDMIPHEKLEYYLESQVIQIAPLAFMRGRTLDNAFVILDEAQNTTKAQMKMFLTRMGQSAKFIITGDKTQIDLPRNQASGLHTATRILKDIEGIAFVKLDDKDVIRHQIVKDIIKAYDSDDAQSPTGN